MLTRRLGSEGPEVGAIGLGCMGMSWGYAESQRDDQLSVKVLEQALDLGVTLLDTSDVYGDGHNEALVGRLLARRRDEAVVATKVGLVVDDLTTRAMHRDGSPEHIRRAAEASLRRLNTDVIDLYYLHRVDPDVPLEDSWGQMAELVREGKVRHLGLSEVSLEEAERAHGVHPVAAIQSELSLWTRDPLVSGADVVGWCAEHGAAFLPYAPLGRGFLTGTFERPDFEDGDFRATNPRFSDSAFTANLRIVDAVRSVAARRGATPAQVALAWTLAQGEHLIPIPGTRTPRYLAENAEAAALALTAADLAELDAVPMPVGSRY
ncbi:aldo/keto reductase [Streptomyces tubercidicus]|uniref:aldo/keto reductase n=1 Tax=Streptomyces tubercidicus TaxID=47759 RepID=UPI002E103079|nr:aldo/keto reductase [Streptomyces tubercidicus]WSX21494.1 aldo/keto reductase [Streptomyces tubercidicus]